MNRSWNSCGLILCLLVASCCFVHPHPAAGDGLKPIPDPAFGEAEQRAPERGLSFDGDVVRVIDGDTLIVRTEVEYRVRLLDCWAPETRTRNDVEKVKGLESKARMEELSDGRRVRVFIPIQSKDLSQAMTLGRVLGRVWRIDETGQPEHADLSSVMVQEGLATATKEPVR